MIVDNHKCKTGYGVSGGSSLELWVGMAGGEAEEVVELLHQGLFLSFLLSPG